MLSFIEIIAINAITGINLPYKTEDLAQLVLIISQAYIINQFIKIKIAKK